jgi:hypothetical protein
MSLPFSIPCRAINSQHTRDSFPFFFPTFFPLHLVWLDQILGADHLLDVQALGVFLARCQYKFGGIGKAPDEHPDEHPCPNTFPSLFFLASSFSPLFAKAKCPVFVDPYHTYLSIAAAAISSPDPAW